MYNPTELAARINVLGEAVEGSRYFATDHFRAALCDLIRAIPPEWGSQARDLCLEESCPIGSKVVGKLQRDIADHSEDIEYNLIFYPLLRVAIAIRAGELSIRPE